MSNTAFVTGATGFLGQNLVEVLRRADWRVVALHRTDGDTALIAALGAELAEGDITDPESLHRAIPDGCDALFHTAAMTSVWKKQADEQTRVNVDGTRNVVEAALVRGVGRLIHTSTWNVYDWQAGPLTEATPKTGETSWINYNRTKHLAETVVLQAVAARGLDAVILNPPHILGRYDRQNWARMIAMTALGKLPGLPPGAGDFAHGPEVARAHLAAFEKGRCGQNYLLGGPHATFMDLVQTVARLANQPKVPKKPVPPVLMKLMGVLEERFFCKLTGREPQVTPEAAEMVSANVTIASTLARDELGYDPPTLEFALNDSYKWLMKAGLIRS